MNPLLPGHCRPWSQQDWFGAPGWKGKASERSLWITKGGHAHLNQTFAAEARQGDLDEVAWLSITRDLTCSLSGTQHLWAIPAAKLDGLFHAHIPM